MEFYYAIFYPLEDEWGVRFPDVPGVNTSGKDIDEALEMAVDALSGLLVLGRKGRDYTAPRTFDEIQTEAKEGELIFPVMATETAMNEYRPKKRVNVMVPVDLLERIGKHIKGQKGLDRSKFICSAVESHLGRVPVAI